MIDKVAGAAVQGANEIAKAPKVQSFGKVMNQAKPVPAAQVQIPQKVQSVAQKPKLESARIQAKPHAPVTEVPKAASLMNEVSAAQSKLDQILKMAESGRTFSPAELLAFQAHAYRASQELDLAGKVVENATSGVKQTLNTQV